VTRPTPNEAAVRAAVSGLEAKDESSGNDGGTEAVVDSAPAAEAAEGQTEQTEQPEEDPLTVAQRERDEYLDLAKRTQAEFENYRKRGAKDIAAAGSRARIGLIREILPVVDNLERALGVAPEGAHDAFVEGVRLVYRDLQGALTRAGVETIEPTCDAFDPNVHEALSMRPQEGAEPGTVVDVVEKGYRTADTVVRPARVVVAA
jgi:molecular chaperone GrpE